MPKATESEQQVSTIMHRLPAEWEPQRALVLTWPHSGTDWADRLDAVERVYIELTRTLCRYQRALILCADRDHQARVKERLGKARVHPHRLSFAIAPSNDTWTRDHGPITVVDSSGDVIFLDFRFNGWGGKYPAELDDRINGQLRDGAVLVGGRWRSSDLVLEGGAIESDGQGSLLMMRRTIIDPARNPGWTIAEVESELRRRLGAQRFLWLDHGLLSGDDTDGHIDTLARFVDTRTICYQSCRDPQDPDHDSIRRMLDELGALRDAQDHPYRLIPLPSPQPIQDEDGQRLPASYANFALINGAVLLPVYQDPADTEAIEVLRRVFPERTVEPIDCRVLINQGGSLHCACMQLPAAASIDCRL